MKRIFILFVLLILSSICALADDVLDVKLPPDYKIIVKNQDFPVTLRPLVQNGTFRVMNYQLLYKDKFEDNMIHKIQILNGNQILYEGVSSDLNSKVYMNADDWVSNNMNHDYIGEHFDKYIIVHGKDKDYFLYMITFPTASSHYPSYLLGYNKGNTKIVLYSDDISGNLQLLNPKNKNGEYELIDDKYINTPAFDGWFRYVLQYEIIGDTVNIVDKEYEILPYPNISLSHEPKEIILYFQPSFKSNNQKIKIVEKSVIKIIGIRIIKDNKFLHIIIDNKEGWIEEIDSQNLGFGPASI